MIPEDHNKFLGWAHLAYGALFTLLGLAIGLFLIIFGATLGNGGGRDDPPGLLVAGLGALMMVIYCGLALPSVIAGYALLKRKKWAKIAGIIAAVFASMSFPFGTAVCVYTFWFMFSEPGKQLYDTQSAPTPTTADWRTPPATLNPPHANDWRAQTQTHETRRPETYMPTEPPNWRE